MASWQKWECPLTSKPSNAEIHVDYSGDAHAQGFHPPLLYRMAQSVYLPHSSAATWNAAGRYCAPSIDRQGQCTLKEVANLIEEYPEKDPTLPARDVRL